MALRGTHTFSTSTTTWTTTNTRTLTILAGIRRSARTALKLSIAFIIVCVKCTGHDHNFSTQRLLIGRRITLEQRTHLRNRETRCCRSLMRIHLNPLEVDDNELPGEDDPTFQIYRTQGPGIFYKEAQRGWQQDLEAQFSIFEKKKFLILKKKRRTTMSTLCGYRLPANALQTFIGITKSARQVIASGGGGSGENGDWDPPKRNRSDASCNNTKRRERWILIEKSPNLEVTPIYLKTSKSLTSLAF
ncbi:unnamed protein product [Nesidiocoris tenuis]|uniref:Uncharacterized protein n=1 Tax=Nesidiocoris tenuis TaxID=355587 RepID=A0A6H5GNQ3_9HEMI|nr:unnamed protein product [Nesidiocoris tenuis]